MGASVRARPGVDVAPAAGHVRHLRAAPQGVGKIDLSAPKDGGDAMVASIHYGGGRGGEAFFVPRHEDPDLCDGEDDGFLLVYVYEAAEDVSYLHVYNARTMAKEPLAKVCGARGAG